MSEAKEQALAVIKRIRERVERDGWHKGSMIDTSSMGDDFGVPALSDPEVDKLPKCIAGHLYISLQDVFGSLAVDEEDLLAVIALQDAVCFDVTPGYDRGLLWGYWNDKSDRTEEDIFEALRYAEKRIANDEVTER